MEWNESFRSDQSLHLLSLFVCLGFAELPSAHFSDPFISFHSFNHNDAVQAFQIPNSKFQIPNSNSLNRILSYRIVSSYRVARYLGSFASFWIPIDRSQLRDGKSEGQNRGFQRCRAPHCSLFGLRRGFVIFIIHNFLIFIIQIVNVSCLWKCHVWVWLIRVYEHVLIVPNLTVIEFVWQAKLASIMASFIIHKPPQRTPFSKAALKTVDSDFKLFFCSELWLVYSCL